MEQVVAGRIIAGIISSFAAAMLIQFNEVRLRRLTREQFLEHQAKRYDKPASFPAFVIIIGFFIGIYELLCFGLRFALG